MNPKYLFIALSLVFSGLCFSQNVVNVSYIKSNNGGFKLQMLGEVTSKAEMTVSSYANAHLESVLYAGSMVKKGDVVAQLDTQFLVIERDLAALEIEKEKENINFLQRKVDRQKYLKHSSSVSEADLEASEQDLKQARIALAMAELKLKELGIKLKRSTMRAEMDAVIAERFVNQGDYLAEGTKLLKLIPQGNVEIVSQLPMEYLHVLFPGDYVDISSSYGNGRFTITRMLNVVTDDTQSISIFMRPEQDVEHQLTVGMQLSLVASIVEQDTLAIPFDALIPEPNGAYVYVVSPDNIVKKRSVNILASTNGQYIVNGAVNAGDQVVIRGMRSLSDGDTVTVKTDKES